MDQFEYPSAGNVIPLESKLKDGGRDTGRPLDARAGDYPPQLVELIACDSEAGLREFSVLRQLQSWLRAPQ